MKTAVASQTTAIIAVVIIVIVALGGYFAYTYYAGPSKTTSGTTSTTTAATVKVAMILPGVISDGSWNLAGYQAIEEMGNSLHVPVAYTESVGVADFTRVASDYLNTGYNVIIADSFDYGTALFQLAKAHPSDYFIWGGGAVNYSSNVVDATWLGEQGTYLLGIIAAGASKTGVVGFVTSFQFDTTNANINGFIQGACAQNPNIKVVYAFTGSWGDTSLGIQAAQSLHAQGADVIEGLGDGLTLGVIEASQQGGYFSIGYIVDQNGLAPRNVISSLIWGQANEYTYVVRTILNGTFRGQLLNWGYKLGGVTIAPTHGLQANISQSALTLLASTQAKIQAGTFTPAHNGANPPASPVSCSQITTTAGSAAVTSPVLLLPAVALMVPAELTAVAGRKKGCLRRLLYGRSIPCVPECRVNGH